MRLNESNNSGLISIHFRKKNPIGITIQSIASRKKF